MNRSRPLSVVFYRSFYSKDIMDLKNSFIIDIFYICVILLTIRTTQQTYLPKRQTQSKFLQSFIPHHSNSPSWAQSFFPQSKNLRPLNKRFIYYYSPAKIIPENEKRPLFDEEESNQHNSKQNYLMQESSGHSKHALLPIPNIHLTPPAINSLSHKYRLKRPKHRKIVKKHEELSSKSKAVNDKINSVRIKNEDHFKLPYVRDHAPDNVQDPNTKTHTEAQMNTIIKNDNETKSPLGLSPDGDRLEFQLRGHDGPTSYVFGYDTGDGKNRQYRLEERFKDGTVQGQYGYYDAKGKLRAIKYSAGPLEGYQERHHESNARTPEN